MFFGTLVIFVVAVGPIRPAASGQNTTDSCNDSVIRSEAKHFYGLGVSGRSCISPCAAGGGHCLIEYSWPPKSERCWILQFYTMQFEDKPLCIGPCRKNFGRPGYKCAVNATHWDRCNPNTTHELVYEARTLIGGDPCEGDCTADDRGVYACRVESGTYAVCDPRAEHFIRASAYDGQLCVNRCQPREGKKWLSCHTKHDDKPRPCAPPARFYMRADSILAV